eukprot:2405640-Rhodomonas_salina.1
MSIHTSIQESAWTTSLLRVGLREHEAGKLVAACVKECVIACHKLYNTRLSRLEALRANGQANFGREGIG